MSDEPEPRRRRDPAVDVEDVFEQLKDQLSIDGAYGTADLADWGDNLLLSSDPRTAPHQVIGEAISAEILTSLHWTETFVEGLTVAGGLTTR